MKEAMLRKADEILRVRRDRACACVRGGAVRGDVSDGGRERGCADIV